MRIDDNEDFKLFSELFSDYGFDLQLYAFMESGPKLHGPRRIEVEDAPRLNREGYGIFYTPNAFVGDRKKENLKRIQAWFVENDSDSKEIQYGRLNRAPIRATALIESKRSIQALFFAEDPQEHCFSEIQRRLVYNFNGDSKATDLARLFRAPGFYHLKDPSNKFLVRFIQASSSMKPYSELTMLRLQAPRKRYNFRKLVRRDESHLFHTNDSGIFATIDCAEALMKVSETEYVNGDIFELRPQANGNLNIIANGNDSGCFVDDQGLIGSKNKGGPTIVNWLMWYGRSYEEAASIVRKLYPERFNRGNNNVDTQTLSKHRSAGPRDGGDSSS